MMPMQEVLRLTRWEWFKLRRLRLPWVLLAIAVLISQMGIWTNYLAYHNDTVQQVVTGTFASYSVSWEEEGREVSVTMTCADAVRGRVPTGLDQIPEERLQEYWENVDEWLADGTCENFQSAEELRRGFTLPNSMTASISGFSSLGPVAIGLLLIMILTASLVGSEYGWGTLRTVLAGGIGRWRFLSAKLLLLLCLCAGVLTVIAAVSVASSLAAGLLSPDETGGLVDAGKWSDVAIISFKSVYGFLPFIALSGFATVLTSSRGLGIALSVGYFIVESIVAPLLNLNDTLANAADRLLIQGFRAWTATPVGEGSSETSEAFVTVLAYTVFFVAATSWIFKRRDIGGAAGD